jgi:WD40 repeat protein
VTKRKSWLKRLKGALKTSSKDGLAKGGSARSVATYDSLDDTDASSVVGSLSGDGSPKRDSSFAGLDRNEFSKRGSVSGLSTDGIDTSFWRKPQKVKVKLRQKSSRDLSQLHLSQEILAHQGATWTMKFGPDGRYLASAGQDRVVCVWEVVDHPLVADSGKPAAYIFSLRSEYRPYWFADRKSHRSGEQQSFVVKSTSSFIIYSRMLMLKSGS